MLMTPLFNRPYQSIAFANHGPDSDGVWAFTKDLSVPCTEESTDETIAKLSPLLELMMSVLEKALMSKEHTTHIAILACKAAGCDPKLIPTLEQLYNVDFMASTDDTGNASSGGNWKMETDGVRVNTLYLDPKQSAKYRGKMGWEYEDLLSSEAVYDMTPALEHQHRREREYAMATGDWRTYMRRW